LNVSVATGGTAVTVEKGNAIVRSEGGEANVGAGQKSVARPGTVPSPPVAVYGAAVWRGRKGPAILAPVEGELAVVSFTLIDAARNQPIAGYDPLPDGAVLDLSKLPTRHLNIRANTIPEDGISVRFDLDRRTKFKLEQVSPYALNGDRDGNYDVWTPSAGEHTITATPFADIEGRGRSGKPLRITVQVVDP
jgi:hypothetical protein